MSKIRKTVIGLYDWLNAKIDASCSSRTWKMVRSGKRVPLSGYSSSVNKRTFVGEGGVMGEFSVVDGMNAADVGQVVDIKHVFDNAHPKYKVCDRRQLRDRVSRNIEWFLEAYPGLDKVEKLAVDDFVSAHPEYQSRLRDARSMNELIYDSLALVDAKRDSKTVQFAFVSNYISPSLIPKSLSMALTRFMRRLSGDAEVEQAYAEYQDRVDDLSQLRPAIDHFEEVSGHVIREPRTEYLPGAGRPFKSWKSRRGISGARKRNGDRAATPGRHDRMVKAAASVANTLAIVAAVIVVLYSVDYANQSPTERMAHIRASDLDWVDVGLSNRGILLDWEIEALENYERAVKIIKRSRKSVFGLFPTYRPEDLYRARRIIVNVQSDRRVARRQEPAALLLLGKINFLMGDIDKSIPALRDASFQDGPSAEEAEEFLSLFRRKKK